MGEPIRKSAAVEDIFEDLQTTYNNAKARGGKAAEIADERILPITTIIDSLKSQSADAKKTAGPILAELDARNNKADKAVLKVSDDVWNDVGRPASDAALSILFPGGASFYVDGDVAEQPGRMDLLVELLKAKVHPKLSDAVRLASIEVVTAEAAALRTAVAAASEIETKLLLLDRMARAVATAAAIELANYKRQLKSHGFSEADAHTIIPDHGGASPKATKPPAAPPAAPPATP